MRQRAIRMIPLDITHNGCDLHNSPQRIQFANGNVTQYAYVQI